MDVMKKSDRLIPWYFVLFFAVITLVDGIFVTMAIRTQTGSVIENAYERGLAYNTTIDAVAEQKKRGWQGRIELADGRNIVFHLADRDGKALSGASVQAHITRPVQAGYDFDVTLTTATPGIYSAAANFPLPGLWNVNIEATWQGHHYYLMRSFTVKPDTRRS